MRRLIAFPCEGETLIGTLDEAPGATGLLIVSGGNEVRIGAHRGMALLAQRLAADGTPVFRFDRRGVGDSTGANGGYATSAPDIAAAADTFRREQPQLSRLIGFGNCDAATALALFHPAAGLDALILANPWTGDEPDALPPAAAIRARYVERLRDPAQWRRLLRGDVDLRKLLGGIRKLVAPERPSGLVERMAAALAATRVPVTLVLAMGDATAIAFRARAEASWRTRTKVVATVAIDTASHSFARLADQVALERAVRAGVVQY